MQLFTYIGFFRRMKRRKDHPAKSFRSLNIWVADSFLKKLLSPRVVSSVWSQELRINYIIYPTIPLILDVLNIVDIGENEIRQYIKQICAGCSYLATNNIVHLDLKPENIVCTDILDNGINRLKVSLLAHIYSQNNNQMIKVKFCIILHDFKYFRLLILDLPNAYLMSQVKRL